MNETTEDSTENSDMRYLDEVWVRSSADAAEVDRSMHELRRKGRAPRG